MLAHPIENSACALGDMRVRNYVYYTDYYYASRGSTAEILVCFETIF